ncbi:MAG TPA: hypothetical protein VGN87_11905 [Paenibacillus sp.]|jgi:hypothetical protein
MERGVIDQFIVSRDAPKPEGQRDIPFFVEDNSTILIKKVSIVILEQPDILQDTRIDFIFRTK